MLLDIVSQAGVGLSYGEDLARSTDVVSVSVTAVAADALAVALGWTVFVNPTGQVTVVKAAEPALPNGLGP